MQFFMKNHRDYVACVHNTSSLLAKRELFLIPKEILNRWYGDYARSIYLTISGKVRFLNKTMSVYRYYSKGSWTATIFTRIDSDKAIMLDREKIDMLERCDQYSGGKYTDIFRKVIMAKEADILFKQKKYRDIVLKNKYLRLFYKQYGLLRTCLLLVRAVSCHE